MGCSQHLSRRAIRDHRLLTCRLFALNPSRDRQRRVSFRFKRRIQTLQSTRGHVGNVECRVNHKGRGFLALTGSALRLAPWIWCLRLEILRCSARSEPSPAPLILQSFFRFTRQRSWPSDLFIGVACPINLPWPYHAAGFVLAPLPHFGSFFRTRFFLGMCIASAVGASSFGVKGGRF
jgi:hypothetical protein